jgi:hypothetical protein
MSIKIDALSNNTDEFVEALDTTYEFVLPGNNRPARANAPGRWT